MSSGRPKILIFSARLGDRGGTIQRLKVWFRHMPPDMDVTFVYAPAAEQRCREVLGNPQNVKLVELRTQGLKSRLVLRLVAAIALGKTLVSERYDVLMPVLSDTEVVAFPVARAVDYVLGRKTRIVCHCAGGPVPMHLRGRSLKGRAFGWALRAIYHRVDAIVVISGQVKRELIRDFRVDETRLEVIPISVDEQVLAGSKGTRARDPVVVFGMLCRLHRVKAVDQAVRAFAEVSRTHRVHLLVYGDGPEEASLRRLARSLELNNIEFFGWAPASKALATFDCLVVSSEDEGTPRAILEAGRAGIPSIASSVGGVPDIIDDGRTGWLYQYGDLGGLADHMRHVAEHPEERRRVGEKMREYVMAVHAPAVEVRRLAEALCQASQSQVEGHETAGEGR